MPRQGPDDRQSGRGHRSPVGGRKWLMVDDPEFSMYAALKLTAYAALESEFGFTGSWQPPASIPEIRFSSRKVRQIVSPRGAELHGRGFTDFIGVSSHFIRERLAKLNHGTFLYRGGRGLRGAVEYQWSEGFDASSAHSFAQLRVFLGTRLYLAPDLYRVVENFLGRPFSSDEYVELFHRYREHFMKRRRYAIVTPGAAKSPRYSALLRARLDEMIAMGMFSREADKFWISSKGLDAAHWFDLFIYSMRYAP